MLIPECDLRGDRLVLIDPLADGVEYPYPWGWSRHWGYWGRSGYWGHWGPYAGEVWTDRYLEGSVTFDVIEGDTGELMYRAQVTDEIGNDLDSQVIKTVDKAFKKFPVKEITTK